MPMQGIDVGVQPAHVVPVNLRIGQESGRGTVDTLMNHQIQLK